jgi:regulator of protease activity HflC (stomatin/prohibitin superfamily)
MDLDDAFASKSDLAEAVKHQLQELMSEYGYEIIAALVVDLNPDRHVKAAMNEINGKHHLI